MSSSALPPEPWHSFLAEIDAALADPVFLNCIGGFALTVHYGMSRTTADVDLLEVPAAVLAGSLLTLGREGGPLHRKYKLYVDPVTVAFFPDNYELVSAKFPLSHAAISAPQLLDCEALLASL